MHTLFYSLYEISRVGCFDSLLVFKGINSPQLQIGYSPHWTLNPASVLRSVSELHNHRCVDACHLQIFDTCTSSFCLGSKLNPLPNWSRHFWMCLQRYSKVRNYLRSNFMVAWCLCVSQLQYWNISVKWITGNQRTYFIVHDIWSWRKHKSSASMKEYTKYKSISKWSHIRSCRMS